MNNGSRPGVEVKRTILIAEDSEAHRNALERHFLRSGWEVRAVSSAERALEAYSSVRPDVVLTDLRMDEMTGIELMQRLREGGVDTPVIVMTAYAGMQAAIDAMKVCAYDFLTKPLDLDRLDGILARCFEEHAGAIEAEPADGGDESAVALTLDSLVGREPRMIEIFKTIGAVAGTPAPVLVRGETGTGKELIARMLHANGRTSGSPFMAVNCAALPENLLESELFGHVRGSFTGATGDRRGRFELAGDGTIFLDEIGDTTPAFQTKLLRVLQEGELYPVGGEQPRRTKARVIAATHRPVEEMIVTGAFREDLYFRLRVVEIVIPPLRERKGDIPLLVQHILGRIRDGMGRDVTVPDDVMAAILAHRWPGNVRELENALTRAAVLARGNAIQLQHLGLRRADGPAPTAPAENGKKGVVRSLDEIEAEHVQQALALCAGNKSRVARALRISRPRLDRIIQKHKLTV
jgi:DNA-binding NtrC family response regulator